MGLTAMYRPVRSLLRLSRFSPLAIAMLSLGLTGCLSSSGSSSDDGPAPDAGAGSIESGAEMPDLDPTRVLPIIFVHGVAGSASQYQTQALRFASNGYPDEIIHAYEYSTDGEALVRAAAVGSQNAPLDSFVDNVLTEHEAEQVYLVCHSLGTFVCSGYLGDADRAAKVAGFIGVDGTVAADCPGGVPCKGIFVSRARALGADNLYLEDEAHVQVATSEASFAGQFEFFTGVAPARTQILAEEGTVAVSGRAVNFPANSGAEGTTLNVWSIDEETGVRTQEEPLATAAIDATGVWGPFELEVGARYEFELLRPSRSTQHFYRQPFLRESRLVRLNTSPAGSDIETNTHTSPDHSALVISRDKEFWGIGVSRMTCWRSQPPVRSGGKSRPSMS
ncbi:alpha/beta fold hydrolase [Pseudomonas sp. gcc21]|uniref:alpha/beta fold hydrolase n=1 Tax=Pseudomonas sp. gcc21 TaxID=2726989 RepID=UPI0014515411|nr:alpha/beta fold hydrolase [Pseudomonas sp. gcc21]QJD60390.1 alpha/beta fold hydrolase [Pseudomonas sp. gcc21]